MIHFGYPKCTLFSVGIYQNSESPIRDPEFDVESLNPKSADSILAASDPDPMMPVSDSEEIKLHSLVQKKKPRG